MALSPVTGVSYGSLYRCRSPIERVSYRLFIQSLLKHHELTPNDILGFVPVLGRHFHLEAVPSQPDVDGLLFRSSSLLQRLPKLDHEILARVIGVGEPRGIQTRSTLRKLARRLVEVLYRVKHSVIVAQSEPQLVEVHVQVVWGRSTS